MITVMVVDDNSLIRAGLAALLRATPGFEVVAEAAGGMHAIQRATETRPDVVLMDIRMPGVDGITAMKRILAEAGSVPPRVIMLTTFDLDQYVYEALRAGASGFLLKETQPRQLVSAIRVVAEGEKLFAPTVIKRLIDAYVHRPDVPSAPSLSELTPRELEILRLVATGRTNTEIAAGLTISEATVKTHLNRTMTKLSLTSRAQAVMVAYESGLVTPSR
ncbi:response regulator transcription factor [Lentzea sp. NPDC005914]|uniref:response regulator transcription factor n=1 Tax=Lentzea sp. NPDC005914 TaxID=3154572 RepID=UPI0033F2F975